MRQSTKWRIVGIAFGVSVWIIPLLPERPDEMLRQATCMVLAAVLIGVAAILDAISLLHTNKQKEPA